MSKVSRKEMIDQLSGDDKNVRVWLKSLNDEKLNLEYAKFFK